MPLPYGIYYYILLGVARVPSPSSASSKKITRRGVDYSEYFGFDRTTLVALYFSGELNIYYYLFFGCDLRPNKRTALYYAQRFSSDK